MEDETPAEWTPDQLAVLKQFTEAQRKALTLADVTAVFNAMFESRVLVLDDRFVTQSQLTDTMTTLRSDIGTLTASTARMETMLTNAGLNNGGAKDLRKFLADREDRSDFYAYLGRMFAGRRGKVVGAIFGALLVAGSGGVVTFILHLLGVK